MSARTTVSLSGEGWKLGEGADPRSWIAARVPGNIQQDLWRAGLKPDPYIGANADTYRDTEAKTWTYERCFNIPTRRGLTWTLQFESIDYEADVFLNGRLLGRHEGAYGEICFPVTRLLRRRDNRLRLVIQPLKLAPRLSRAVVDPLAPLRHDGRWMVKPLVSFSWDFAPRLVPTGIGKDVRLVGTRGIRLHGARTDCELAPNHASAALAFTACVWSETARKAETVLELFAEGSPMPVLICRTPCSLACGENEITLSGLLEQPRLWWPSGMGEPHLYTAVLRVVSRGILRDELSFAVGVRTIRMVRTPGDQAAETRIPATSLRDETMLVVNGRPIAYRGINVAPLDILFGRIDDARIAEMMGLVRDANLNLLRLWGGGPVNRDHFYDLADRCGVMLWQEFPLGCTDHEGDAHYREVLDSEARAMVRALRRHPSLVIWGGGNELFLPHSGMGPQDRTVRLLQSVCTSLDPDRIFLPTTPYPGAFHGPYTFDCFGQGEFGASVDHVRFCNDAPAGAYNECGVAGPSFPSTIRACAPAAEAWPPRRGGTWEFHKAFGAWGGGDAWLLPDLIERYFGRIGSLEDLCRAGQFLQAIGLQYLLEEMRRKWPDVPGTMPWCFNTPWTSFAGSFVVAYPARPLPGYHALRTAYVPRNVSARLASFVARPGQTVTFSVHILNDGGTPADPGTVMVSAGPLGESAWLRRSFDAPGVGSMGRASLGDTSLRVPADFTGVLTIDLAWRHPGGTEANRCYLGVARGEGPSECFRPLLELWENDPATRLVGME